MCAFAKGILTDLFDGDGDFNQGKVVGVIVVSFVEQYKVEIVGIAVDIAFRNRGIGSYMINCLCNDYSLISIYAETDKDAVGFYIKNSFKITAFSENYDGETIIRYKCERSRLCHNTAAK